MSKFLGWQSRLCADMPVQTQDEATSRRSEIEARVAVYRSRYQDCLKGKQYVTPTVFSYIPLKSWNEG